MSEQALPSSKEERYPDQVRAENTGVLVHPTPEGVRAAIATGGEPVADRDGGSYGAKSRRALLLAAKRPLHHHRRVLANKVASADERRRDAYSGSAYMFDFPPATRPLPTLPYVSRAHLKSGLLPENSRGV